MASLKEIKGRIGSVKSTLKITSAMKMVSSAKLHKAQQAIGSMLPYQRQLSAMLNDLLADYASKLAEGKVEPVSLGGFSENRPEVRNVAVLAFASNSSLCGAFNANAARKTLETVREIEASGASVTVFAAGKKMSEALRKNGIPISGDYHSLVEKPSYSGAAELASMLMEGFLDGRFDRVELVYNHFASTASQPPVREVFLPAVLPAAAPGSSGNPLYIVEPSLPELLLELLPKVLKLKVYTALLDTVAAEHAARTVAMQTATDNGNDILRDLTLEYNKGRQQKITSEILDIVGGSMV